MPGRSPSLIRQGLTSVTMGLLNNMTKPFGDAAIAAMSVVNRYSNFLICVGLGIGQGFQPVAAFNYQARKFDRVKRVWCSPCASDWSLSAAFPFSA